MKLLITFVFAATQARLFAAPFCSFECLAASDSNLQICAPVAPQFSLELVDLGAGIAGFQFANAGPAAVSVTNLFFSDPTNLVAAFANVPWSATGVLFAPGGPDIVPASVPAGFTTEFRAQAIGGATLSPGESVTVQMALTPGSTVENVRLALIDSQFRVIVATVGIGGPDRTQYLEASCCDEIPEPGPMLMVGLGLAGLGLRRRAAG